MADKFVPSLLGSGIYLKWLPLINIVGSGTNIPGFVLKVAECSKHMDFVVKYFQHKFQMNPFLYF